MKVDYDLELRVYVTKIFRESKNPRGEPDSLAAYSEEEIDSFINKYEGEFEDSVSEIRERFSTGGQFDYATEFFEKLPIGWMIIVLKNKNAMIEELNDLGARFINVNMNEIENAAHEMQYVYAEEGKSQDLYTAELDWYREFLYKHVTRPTNRNE